jgi:hypothetical protein
MNPQDVVVATFAFLTLGGALWVFRPLVAALANRVGGEGHRGATPDQLAALRGELLDHVQQVHQEVGELAERLDFTERLLARQREGERLAPPQPS